MTEAAPPATKKKKRSCHFDKKWMDEFQGIGRSHKGIRKFNSILVFNNTGDAFAKCTLCGSDFSIAHGGRNDVTTHVSGSVGCQLWTRSFDPPFIFLPAGPVMFKLGREKLQTLLFK